MQEKMEVTVWQGPPQPIPARISRRHNFFFPPALLGILGTLLLHVLLVGTLSLGGRNLKTKAPETPQSANSLQKENDSSSNLVLLVLPAANASQSLRQTAISPLPDLSKLKIKIEIPADVPNIQAVETLALSDEEPVSQVVGHGDVAELTRLFGIYNGQIKARIDRGWLRPRSPIQEDNVSTETAESFQCKVQIVQDARGNIQEILLLRCNGSPAWQHSLVVAIQQASPLPAPPDLKVFTHSIILDFIGLPFIRGESSELYEQASSHGEQLAQETN
jgi:hypothetical protein